MKEAIFCIPAGLLILLPYGILFTKGLKLTVRLLFVSIVELAVYGLLGAAFYVTDLDLLLAFLIYFNFFLAISLPLNGLLLAISWFRKRPCFSGAKG